MSGPGRGDRGQVFREDVTGSRVRALDPDIFGTLIEWEGTRRCDKERYVSFRTGTAHLRP